MTKLHGCNFSDRWVANVGHNATRSRLASRIFIGEGYIISKWSIKKENLTHDLWVDFLGYLWITAW